MTLIETQMYLYWIINGAILSFVLGYGRVGWGLGVGGGILCRSSEDDSKERVK